MGVCEIRQPCSAMCKFARARNSDAQNFAHRVLRVRCVSKFRNVRARISKCVCDMSHMLRNMLYMLLHTCAHVGGDIGCRIHTCVYVDVLFNTCVYTHAIVVASVKT